MNLHSHTKTQSAKTNIKKLAHGKDSFKNLNVVS